MNLIEACRNNGKARLPEWNDGRYVSYDLEGDYINAFGRGGVPIGYIGISNIIRMDWLPHKPCTHSPIIKTSAFFTAWSPIHKPTFNCEFCGAELKPEKWIEA